MKIEQNMYSKDTVDPIFRYIAESLKNDLTKINSSIEYSMFSGDITNLDVASYSTSNMLRLIDCYLKYISDSQNYTKTEPVSLSAMLSSIMSTMKPYADSMQCDLDLSVEGKYRPVMANRDLLRAVLSSLSGLLISAQSEIKHTSRPLITFAVSKTTKGVSAGLYSDIQSINSDMLRKARALYGKANNPINSTISNNSIGLYIADSLLSRMSLGLKVGKLHNMTGLVATFKPSQQLYLV